jgi:hypothetical protein
MNNNKDFMKIFAVFAIGINVLSVSLHVKELHEYKKCIKNIVEKNEVIKF